MARLLGACRETPQTLHEELTAEDREFLDLITEMEQIEYLRNPPLPGGSQPTNTNLPSKGKE